MSIAGGAIGLIGGGLLTTYALVAVGAVRQRVPSAPRSRWPPRGCWPSRRAAAAGSTCPARSRHRRGHRPGLRGLISAATTPDGVSHWGDAKVLASLAAAVVLLAAFAVTETRSRYALLPVRLLRDRNPHRRPAELRRGGQSSSSACSSSSPCSCRPPGDTPP